MNAGSSAAAAYKAANVENAPPLKLLRLMYEGALRFMDQAELAFREEQPTRYQDRCMRAQAIVSELRLALDPSQAPDLAANLDALYLFCEDQLRRAGLETLLDPLVHAREIVQTLLEGWKSIEVQS